MKTMILFRFCFQILFTTVLLMLNACRITQPTMNTHELIVFNNTPKLLQESIAIIHSDSVIHYSDYNCIPHSISPLSIYRFDTIANLIDFTSSFGYDVPFWASKMMQQSNLDIFSMIEQSSVELEYGIPSWLEPIIKGASHCEFTMLSYSEIEKCSKLIQLRYYVVNISYKPVCIVTQVKEPTRFYHDPQVESRIRMVHPKKHTHTWFDTIIPSALRSLD